jgi:hypothetical protein
MASVVLNADAGYDQLYASGVLAGGRGLTTSGGVIASSVSVQAPKNTQSTIVLTATGDGVAGNVAVVSWEETSAALSQVAYNWQLGTGGGGGAIQEGHLALDAYVAGGFSQGLVEVGPCPRGSAGPPIIPANSAIFGLVSPAQRGVATIALGASTIAVPQTSITANSIVMLTGVGAPDTTATTFDAVLTAGTGFTITANANATAAKTVAWFIVSL